MYTKNIEILYPKNYHRYKFRLIKVKPRLLLQKIDVEQINCHILIDLLSFKIVSLNPFLSMHVCRATIQDCKKIYFKNPELIPDF
jgi:hypothetical protein